MTGSSEPNAGVETSQFVCESNEPGLSCRSVSTKHEIFIAAEDILCVLPRSVEESPGYKVLFLQRQPEETKSDACGGCTRLKSIQTASLPFTLLSQYSCTEMPRHLDVSSESQRTNVHVIISSGSGTGSANGIFQNIIQPLLLQFGLGDYEVHETVSNQSITELTRSRFIEPARTGISQTIIILSGDGGLADMVDVFYSHADPNKAPFTPPNIVLIPCGTGNAMASSIGLRQHPMSGLMTLLRGRPVRLPVFRATLSPGSQYITDEGQGRTAIKGKHTTEHESTDIYGAVVASWGVHAALVADSDTTEYRKFGIDRFKMAAKELLYPSSGAETHTYRGVITLTMVDRQTGERYTETMKHNEHMYMLATLVSRLEKDFMISPDSKPLGDQLRVIRFGPMPPEEAMRLMALAYQNGKHVHDEAVTYAEVERLKVEFQEDDEKWRRVCVDGKIVAVQQGGWMEVCKESKHLLNLVTCT